MQPRATPSDHVDAGLPAPLALWMMLSSCLVCMYSTVQYSTVHYTVSFFTGRRAPLPFERSENDTAQGLL